MEETTICKMCSEPINNYICVNCLLDSTLRWFKANNRLKLIEEYKIFFHNLTQQFSLGQEEMFCLKCKNRIETVLCIYCFARETYWWIFARNIKLAQKFAQIFDYDFQGTGYLSHRQLRKPFSVAIVDPKTKTDLNLCDNCDSFNDLKEISGLWLCENCHDDHG